VAKRRALIGKKRGEEEADWKEAGVQVERVQVERVGMMRV
jgi:hypothetical protein